MGIWSACASVGNIIGTLISSRMVVLGYQVYLFTYLTYSFVLSTLLLLILCFCLHSRSWFTSFWFLRHVKLVSCLFLVYDS